MSDELVTVEEAAARLGLRPATIYSWKKRGYLAPFATYRASVGGPRRSRMMFLWSAVLDADRQVRAGASGQRAQDA